MQPGFLQGKLTLLSICLKQGSVPISKPVFKFKNQGHRKFEGLVPNYFRSLCYIQELNMNPASKFTSIMANPVFYFLLLSRKDISPVSYCYLLWMPCQIFHRGFFFFCYIFVTYSFITRRKDHSCDSKGHFVFRSHRWNCLSLFLLLVSVLAVDEFSVSSLPEGK